MSKWKTKRLTDEGYNRRDRVKCGCGREVWASTMVVVRELPNELTGGADAVCDGCWTSWERNHKTVKTKKPKDHREWRKEWAEALGAPQSHLDQIPMKKK